MGGWLLSLQNLGDFLVKNAAPPLASPEVGQIQGETQEDDGQKSGHSGQNIGRPWARKHSLGVSGTKKSRLGSSAKLQ